MNNHPIATPASSSFASPIFDAWFDTIESLTTTFASPIVPTLETTTVTEVVSGCPHNGQYSITAMTTSTGAVAERYAYTGCGQSTILNASGTVLTSPAVGNRCAYTGTEWDETLGLHHFRARWMSPLAGRFLGRDPIEFEDGNCLYIAYFILSHVDPSGKQILKPNQVQEILGDPECKTDEDVGAVKQGKRERTCIIWFRCLGLLPKFGTCSYVQTCECYKTWFPGNIISSAGYIYEWKCTNTECSDCI